MQQDSQSLPEEHLTEETSQPLRELATLTRDNVALFWHSCARDLPWRFGHTTPWGVLVCEVMSQQTQMSRVVPYWLTWMQTWPDAQSLAHATSAEIITAWGRLGYPRRALRLQSCAQVVATRYRNKLPCTYEELIALPGVGDYTASAILSFAYGKHIAVIDTNIRRVLMRAFTGTESHGGSTTQSDRELAAAVLPEDNHVTAATANATNTTNTTCTSSVWNQAIMKLVLPFAQHDLRNALHVLCKHGAVSKLLDFQVLAAIPAPSSILPALIGKCAALFCRHCVKHIKNSRYCNVARSIIYGRIKHNLANALLRSIMTVLSLYCQMAL